MNKKYPDKLFIILGVTLILIKAVTPEYIDENGILHEAFFLLPIGFGLIIFGIIIFIIKIIKTKKHPN